MSKTCKIATVTLAILILSTSIAGQWVKARPARDYFPLRVGNLWKYRHSEAGEFTLKVLKAEKQADGTTLYMLEKQSGGRVHSWYTNANGWVILRREVYVESDNLFVTYQPPKQILKNPPVPGATWTWNGKGAVQVEVSETNKVVGPERVVVPAGTFRAMKVVSVISEGAALKTVTNWYADGVGLVKSTSEAGEIKFGWELIEYKVK